MHQMTGVITKCFLSLLRYSYQRIIDASCTENGGDGGDTGHDVSPDGTDKLSTSVTNRVCIAAGKAAKSASQYWTHRDLKAS
jgi:hypothetical protein